MANYCGFDMKVTGRKENIERLYKMLTYDKSEKYEFNRVFYCEYTYGNDLEESEEFTYTFLHGDCAHSVDIGMFLSDKESNVISMEDASKLLELKVEIVSEECSCNFTEHVVVDNGKILIKTCEKILTDEDIKSCGDDEDALNDLYCLKSEEIINKLY